MQLDESGLEVLVAPGVRLRTPGLTGEVVVHEPSGDGMRGAESTAQTFLDALAANEVDEDVMVEIRDPREVEASIGTRASSAGDDVTLVVREPADGRAKVVLYESEDGVLSWHFSKPHDDGIAFRIPRNVALADDDSGQRGILGAAGKKILKVLAFRLVREGAKLAGNHFARKIEREHKPHRLRAFDPATYTSPVSPDLTLDELRARTSGDARTLLLVHGTFSSAYGAFHKLSLETLTALHQHYDRRVIAFDHPTISVTPAENVQWLASYLRDADVRLNVDIVSHSRGGLVSRILTERPDLGETAGLVDVGRLVMVASPNAGTALADVKRLEHLLNRYTSLLQLVPDNGITDVLDIVLAVVKQVAAGVAEGLDGLMAMNPRGSFLTDELNLAAYTGSPYFAVASNFEPTPDDNKLIRIARDGTTDVVFGQAQNDLVVPTDGVATWPNGAAFDSDRRVLFTAAQGVDHSGYWDRPAFTEHLIGWLG